MARPPLPIGAWGKISRKEVEPGIWHAMARFRDFDGKTRQVERRVPGKNGAAAERALVAELLDRANSVGADITRESRLSAIVPLWWAEQDDKNLADRTRDRYTDVVDNHIIPGVGNLRMREATVPAMDRFLKTLSTSSGKATAKHAKSILSGILGLAVRHGVLDANPLRDVSPVRTESKAVRALTVDEARALRAGLQIWQEGKNAAGRARPQDLLDVIDVMLATGCRIGEAMALRWSDIDLASTPATATINGTVIFAKGQGLKWQAHPKSEGSRLTYSLPAFARDMLFRRSTEVVRNPYDVVFPSDAGTLRDPSNYRKQWNKAREDLGFTWVTPHTFRKSVGTILANSSGIDAAAAQLGHSSTAITSRHYVERSLAAPDHADILQAFGATGDG